MWKWIKEILLKIELVVGVGRGTWLSLVDGGLLILGSWAWDPHLLKKKKKLSPEAMKGKRSCTTTLAAYIVLEEERIEEGIFPDPSERASCACLQPMRGYHLFQPSFSSNVPIPPQILLSSYKWIFSSFVLWTCLLVTIVCTSWVAIFCYSCINSSDNLHC